MRLVVFSRGMRFLLLVFFISICGSVVDGTCFLFVFLLSSTTSESVVDDKMSDITASTVVLCVLQSDISKIVLIVSLL